VRLTAENGYRCETKFSRLPRRLEVSVLELTVDRVDDGEVSSFLTNALQHGGAIQLRGSIEGCFVGQLSNDRRRFCWSAAGDASF